MATSYKCLKQKFDLLKLEGKKGGFVWVKNLTVSALHHGGIYCGFAYVKVSTKSLYPITKTGDTKEPKDCLETNCQVRDLTSEEYSQLQSGLKTKSLESVGYYTYDGMLYNFDALDILKEIEAAKKEQEVREEQAVQKALAQQAEQERQVAEAKAAAEEAQKATAKQEEQENSREQAEVAESIWEIPSEYQSPESIKSEESSGGFLSFASLSNLFGIGREIYNLALNNTENPEIVQSQLSGAEGHETTTVPLES